MNIAAQPILDIPCSSWGSYSRYVSIGREKKQGQERTSQICVRFKRDCAGDITIMLSPKPEAVQAEGKHMAPNS